MTCISYHAFLFLLYYYSICCLHLRYDTGPPGSIYWLPAAPPSPIRLPHPPRFVPHPLNTMPSTLPPETLALRANILKQIEYYFR